LNRALAVIPSQDFYQPDRALQRAVQAKTSSYRGNPVHSVTPSSVQSTWTEGAEMYLASKEKFCARDEHLRRISDALRRRLYPNTPLHQKVLANAIGVTRNTVNNWINAKCDPGSHEMGLLHDFFNSLEGGPVFWAEIYGDLAEPMSKRRNAA
jgi:DNA-binding transcriptional regulator YiaG